MDLGGKSSDGPIAYIPYAKRSDFVAISVYGSSIEPRNVWNVAQVRNQ